MNSKFLKKNKGENYFDLRQKIIRNTEPYYDGLFTDNDLVSKKFVDVEIGKLGGGNALPLDGSKPMTGTLDMGGHIITNLESGSKGEDALTLCSARSVFLPFDGSRALEGDLDMDNHTISGLRWPYELDDVDTNMPDDGETINYKYFHHQRGYLKEMINKVANDVATEFKEGDEEYQLIDNLNASNHKITNLATGTNDDDVVTKKKLDHAITNFSITGDLDMKNNSIINVKDSLPPDSFHAANVNFGKVTVTNNNSMITENYKKYVNTTKAELTKSLTDSFTKKLGESRISAIADKKNVFAYVMADVNESSSATDNC